MLLEGISALETSQTTSNDDDASRLLVRNLTSAVKMAISRIGIHKERSISWHMGLAVSSSVIIG